jgi:hypothetical protein
MYVCIHVFIDTCFLFIIVDMFIYLLQHVFMYVWIYLRIYYYYFIIITVITMMLIITPEYSRMAPQMVPNPPKMRPQSLPTALPGGTTWGLCQTLPNMLWSFLNLDALPVPMRRQVLAGPEAGGWREARSNSRSFKACWGVSDRVLT